MLATALRFAGCDMLLGDAVHLLRLLLVIVLCECYSYLVCC